MWRRAAARPKFCCSATATKYFSWRKSIGSPHTHLVLPATKKVLDDSSARADIMTRWHQINDATRASADAKEDDPDDEESREPPAVVLLVATSCMWRHLAAARS